VSGDLIMNFLLAGRDTTACALTWLIYCLSSNQEVEDKLLAEIKEHVGMIIILCYNEAPSINVINIFPLIDIECGNDNE
jgi:cytochrome P450